MAQSDSSPRLLKSAGLMGIATFLSRMMGLIREQVFAFMFGASNLTDAYQVAFRIPNLLRDLFAEGAMSASLVPVFTQTKIREGENQAWRLAGLAFQFVFWMVLAISLVGIIFAPELVHLYAPAFLKIPGKFELTVRMTRIMYPFFPLVALAAAFMGILNACGIFFLPAFASALFNIFSVFFGVTIVGAIHFFQLNWIEPIEGMAIGVVGGGVVQAFCQLPALYRQGYRWVPRQKGEGPWYQNQALRRMMRMMVPGMAGLAATQTNILVNTLLATSQGPGAVSWLNFAFRLMQFPIGVFGVSLAQATLPRVSTQWSARDAEGVSSTLTHSIQSAFALNLPATSGLIFLSEPIIRLLFEHGKFRSSDTRATALALSMYAGGLTAYSIVKILVPASYAMGNTRGPVLFSAVTVGVTLMINLSLIDSCGYWGLALGTSLGAFVNAGLLFYSTRKLLKTIGSQIAYSLLGWSFVQYALASLAMGLLCSFSHLVLETFISDALLAHHFGLGGVVLGRFVRVLMVVGEGMLFTIFVARAFHLAELEELTELFAGKLKNKLRRRPT